MPLAHAGGIPRIERNDRYVYDTNRGPMTLLLCGTPSVIIYGAAPVYEIHACCETRGGTLSQGTTLNPQSAHMVSSLSQRGREWSLYEWAADGSVMCYPVTGFAYGTPPRKDESRGQAVAGDAATYDMCGAMFLLREGRGSEVGKILVGGKIYAVSGMSEHRGSVMDCSAVFYDIVTPRGTMSVALSDDEGRVPLSFEIRMPGVKIRGTIDEGCLVAYRTGKTYMYAH